MTKEQALNAVEKAIDLAYKRGQELSVHSVSNYFSFAKYLNENFEYLDSVSTGNFYVYETDTTEEDKAKQIKLEKKENIKLIIDFAIILILLPALSGFIGWLFPLQYSILIALLIGAIGVV